MKREYDKLSKSSSSGIQTSNAILERIHVVLSKLVHTYNVKETYVYKDEVWSLILATAAFVIISTTTMLKGCTPVQIIFGRDMILLNKH